MKVQVQKILFKVSKKKKNKAINEEDFDLLLQYCKDGKSLYNFLLFVVRQKFFKQQNKKYSLDFIQEYKDFPMFIGLLNSYFEYDNLFGNDLSTIACRYAEIKSFCFNTKVSQGIYRQLFSDFQSFFKLLKSKKRGMDIKTIKPPKYKRKEYAKIMLNKQVISKRLLDKGYIGPANCKQGIKINNFNITKNNLQAIELNYKSDCLIIDVIYQIPDYEAKTLDSVNLETAKVCGIDMGVNNLFTLAFNFDQKPITLRNGYLKSVNQWYNKETSRLKALLPDKVYTSKKIQSITRKRNEKIKNQLNHYANTLVAMIRDLGIEVVVIGKNLGWKQNLHNLNGKKQFKYKKNKVWVQSFVQLPVAGFIATLKYKLEKAGFVVLLQEESYTSKASFLDKDTIPNYSDTDNNKYVFSGYRRSRGDYKLKGRNTVIHADVNGAYNIMRKAGFDTNIKNCEFLSQKYIYPLSFTKYVKETQKVA